MKTQSCILNGKVVLNYVLFSFYLVQKVNQKERLEQLSALKHLKLYN